MFKRTVLNLSCLVYTWLICCLCVQQIMSMEEGIVYTIEQSPTNRNRLVVSINLLKNQPETHLILRGNAAGVQSQVEKVEADGHPLKTIGAGNWLVPLNCRKLQWEIWLKEVTEINPGEQQSVRYGDFVLISEFSSLPRIEDESKLQTINIVIEGINTIHPEPIQERAIKLHSKSERPLFILLNAIKVKSKTQDALILTYLQDQAGADSLLPDIGEMMKGLQWLSSFFPKKEQEFTLGWCGTSSKHMSITGAAGHGVLLVNYPNDGNVPCNDAMLMYVPLHEAFHQLSDSVSKHRPAWVEESLASYYGCRAVQIALNMSSQACQLMAHFQEKGENFKTGLLAIHKAVKSGNQNEYGAFYTKGVSFWAAVDTILKKQNDSLDIHLSALLHMNYDSTGKPIELMDILHITTEDWRELCRRFLE
jgi:hypothetical protein